MTQMKIDLSPELYFSYSQFFVYDKALPSPACEWTEDHSRQGFARRKGTIAVGTLVSFGHAKVTIYFASPHSFDSYERVISVPLEIESGRLAIEGPEEYPIERVIQLKSGKYRIIIGQRATDDEHEEIGIFVEPLESDFERSEILLADDDLDPPVQLLESAESPRL